MNARSLAYEFMKDVCIHKQYSHLVVRNKLDTANWKDKALITRILYGTLQNFRLCRYQWLPYVEKLPILEVCLLLDMGVYQLLYMDKLPAYAVVNETVQIAKKQIHQTYAKLINAVLHKVLHKKERKVIGTVEEVLAMQTSHPTWLVHMWKAQYGWETTQAICESNMQIQATIARVNTWKTTKQALLNEAQCFVEGTLAQDALIFQGASLVQSTYYKKGLVSIQDEASQVVARIVDPQPKEHILDVCSAPGTKACHMGELMKNQGEIICGDVHAHRVQLIEQGAKRLGLTCMFPMVMDATVLKEIKGRMFDRVLCDVPCTGYGVLARKSDIKYHMQRTDMDTLISLQQDILKASSEHVVSKGMLVYATCTLNKKENEKQIATFLQHHEEYEMVQEQTIFPFQYQSDGFYIAKMRRR